MGFFKDKPAESKNLAYPMISKQYSGTAKSLIGAGQGGLSNIQSILSGTDGGAGFNTYKESTGYENIFDEAMRGVSSSAASRGLLASGSTLRATEDRAGELAKQNFAQYLQQLLGTSTAQLGGGTNILGTIANAGQTSKGAQESGFKQLMSTVASIGQAAGSIAGLSDRRLKDDIELIEREPDGLGIYSFRYKWDSPDDTPHVGVMVDEVAELRPHALGPVIEGYGTVNYEAL